MTDPPAPISLPLARDWGIVYGQPGIPDVLLDQRYTREEVAVRIMRQIAIQFIVQHQHDDPWLERNQSSQNVLRVSSRKTGKTWITMRPVIADRWLDAGRPAAPDEINAFVLDLLDDDEM